MKKNVFLYVFAIVCLGSSMAQEKIVSTNALLILAWEGIPAGGTNVDLQILQYRKGFCA